jgi:PRTRC genetic system protein C
VGESFQRRRSSPVRNNGKEKDQLRLVFFFAWRYHPTISNWDANETFKERTKMTVLKTAPLLREFYYNGVRIPDPGPGMTVEQVRDLLTPTYPEMATASLSGPEDMGDVLRYTFNRAIGSKG